MKETYAFKEAKASPSKEAIESPHKKKFLDAMMKEIEINNHTVRKHWTCCKKSSVPYSQTLRHA